MPTNGETYKHYKGKLYKVKGIAIHSETLEKMVIYECLYENPDGQVWVRPLEMWNETIVVDGVERKRFQLVQSKNQSPINRSPIPERKKRK